MFGEPVPKPPGAIVLCPHWQYSIKRDGTRRSRNCCDGSPRSAPLLHGIASTYSSCVEQPVQRLFFALAAREGYKVYGGDAQDAYAHSPPPETPTFVSIDDAYTDWYEHRFNRKLNRSHVLPVLHALQGHPESGKLWENHISAILRSPPFGFKCTTHDRSIYSATIEGVKVLLLRQVDDFALACPNEALAKRIYDQIGAQLQLPSEDTPPFKYLGLVDDFNGLDVTQYDDSIKLSCEKYIDRVLTTHGWATPSPPHPSKPVAPLPVDAVTSLYQHTGPPESSQEHAALTAKHGFAYRTLLGELLYAYVTCRPDIGYATITLSKFSTCPHDSHFVMLKKVAKYLRATKDWGIIYRKSAVDTSLPPSNFSRAELSADLPSFPNFDAFEPTAFLDAAHANDLRNRRSTTGYAFLLCGGAISYRCKTQSITATSSTEAEFLAAVTAAKHARYIRAIMTELGFPPKHPTTMFCDNQSAINMINARVPTERSRHIDIQHFAIQDWKDSGSLVMKFIPGILNPSDDLTKPLGWVLHARHARRIMGHY
jgi:Reverse transcriptase (RNA-dependent DNA polymerase)